jgi:hypothetical protein
MHAQAPLTFRTPIKGVHNVSTALAMGVTCVLALQATLFPQYHELDFQLYLSCMAAYLLFSACHIMWLIWQRWFGRTLRLPFSPGGPLPPLEGAPVPVPVGPRVPVLRRRDAKELPKRTPQTREYHRSDRYIQK